MIDHRFTNGIVRMTSRSWNGRWIREIILEKKHTITKEKNSVLIAGKRRLTRGWIKRILIYKVLLSVSVFPIYSPYFFF